MATFLSACGGGGSADETTATPSATLASETTPVNLVVVPEPVRTLTITPGYLDLLILSGSNVYQQRDIAINVDYVGDVVAFGYAFGETPVSWLSFSQTTWHDDQGSWLALPLTLQPASLNVGLYETTLTVVAGWDSGNITGVLDVPVYLRVEAAPPVYVGDIVLGGAAGKLADVARTIPLEFNGMVPDEVKLTLSSAMGVASDWITVESHAQASQLTIRAKPDLPVGRYEGHINVAYAIKGARGTKPIRFKLLVHADAPVAQHVAPGYMYVQRANTLVVRGHAFDKAAAISVRVGNTSASSITVIKSTELHARFDVAPTAGLRAVQVVIDGQMSSLGNIDVIAPRTYTAEEEIKTPCQTTSGAIVFDPRRGTIIGYCDDTHYVMGPRYSGGWEVLATRKLDDVDYISWYRSKPLLTADQKYLVVSAKDKIHLLDPVTLETLETHPFQVFWHQSAGYGHIGLEAALNNGQIVLTISGGSEGYGYFAYNIGSRVLTETYQNARSAHVANANVGPAALSTLQLIYEKDPYQADLTSIDPELFTVRTFSPPKGRETGQIFPLVSPDGSKLSYYGGIGENIRFTLYETRTGTVLGPIVSPTSYSSLVQQFTPSGDELYIVDASNGVFEVYGAGRNDTTLRRSSLFTAFKASNFYIMPEQSAVILHGGSNGSGVTGTASIKIIPVPR